MNPLTPTNQKPNQNPQFANFLETLRNKSGFDSVNTPNPFIEQLNHKKELEKRRIEEFQHSRLQEWQNLYSAKDKQTEKAVEEIRLELKRLAQDLTKFDSTINQAIFAPIKKPGVYHRSFLEHIRQVVALIRQEVSQSNSWLSTYRQKAMKHGHYWQQAGKGGTSFMLNNERQIATAVG